MEENFTEDLTSTELITTSPKALDSMSMMFRLQVSMASLIGVVGIAGNALTFIVYSRKRPLGAKWHAAMVKLQAAVDLLGSLVLVLQQGVAFSLTNGYLNITSLWMCKLIGSGVAWTVANLCSTISLVALTVNRYVHTVQPNSSTSNMGCWWIIIMIMAISLVATASCLVISTNFVGPFCLPLAFPQEVVKAAIFNSLIFFYFLTNIVFIFCYGQIFMALKKSNRAIALFQDALTKHQQARAHKAERKVAMTMAIVCLVFFVCCTPLIIWGVLQNYKILELIAVLMAHSNSCVNPIIYCFKHKEFRVRVKQWLFNSNSSNADVALPYIKA